MPEIDAADLASMLKQQGYNVGAGVEQFEDVAHLSKQVKDRVRALKAIQLKSIEIESEFYQKVHALEKEFEGKFALNAEERRQVVAGEREPTEEEKKQPLIHGLSEEEAKEIEDKTGEDTTEKGVPDFWLTVFKAAEGIQEMVTEEDEDVLKYLTDVTSTVELSPPGFTITFHFKENPYFTNTVLTKKYDLELTIDAETPFEYDGPNITKAVGDVINWKDGKDLTKKVVKKKQKKGANAGNFITKTVGADSFFNFFSPPAPEASEEEASEIEELLRADFEVGQILRDHIIPRAVLFFTGEAAEMDMFDDYEDDEDDEDEEEDDE